MTRSKADRRAKEARDDGFNADRHTLLRGHRRNPCKKTQGLGRLTMTGTGAKEDRGDEFPQSFTS